MVVVLVVHVYEVLVVSVVLDVCVPVVMEVVVVLDVVVEVVMVVSEFVVLEKVVPVAVEVTVLVVQKPQARSHIPAESLGQSGQNRMLHTSPSQLLLFGSVHVLQKSSGAMFSMWQ